MTGCAECEHLRRKLAEALDGKDAVATLQRDRAERAEQRITELEQRLSKLGAAAKQEQVWKEDARRDLARISRLEGWGDEAADEWWRTNIQTIIEERNT